MFVLAWMIWNVVLVIFWIVFLIIKDSEVSMNSNKKHTQKSSQKSTQKSCIGRNLHILENNILSKTSIVNSG